MTRKNGAFWQERELGSLSPSEWESLCDGCGRCCLHKLEDEDSGEIAFTAVACRFLDRQRCRCTVYPQRKLRVPGCLVLSLDRPEEFAWLPATCAYRRLAEGKPLPAWHPLLTGDADSVRRAGITVSGFALSEDDVPQEALDDYVVSLAE